MLCQSRSPIMLSPVQKGFVEVGTSRATIPSWMGVLPTKDLVFSENGRSWSYVRVVNYCGRYTILTAFIAPFSCVWPIGTVEDWKLIMRDTTRLLTYFRGSSTASAGLIKPSWYQAPLECLYTPMFNVYPPYLTTNLRSFVKPGRSSILYSLAT